jgi:hypothetical protein
VVPLPHRLLLRLSLGGLRGILGIGLLVHGSPLLNGGLIHRAGPQCSFCSLGRSSLGGMHLCRASLVRIMIGHSKQPDFSPEEMAQVQQHFPEPRPLKLGTNWRSVSRRFYGVAKYHGGRSSVAFSSICSKKSLSSSVKSLPKRSLSTMMTAESGAFSFRCFAGADIGRAFDSDGLATAQIDGA